VTRFFQCLTAVALASTLAACGGTVCDRINASSAAFFSGASECKSGGLTLSKAGTCADTSKCSAADLKTLDTYATCLGKAQACTAGNEDKAIADVTSCFGAAVQGLTAECQSVLK
jgi:hypothetical protein